jgi:hypothetical protein
MKIGILTQHRSGHSAYQQHLSSVLGLPIEPEFDINSRDFTTYLKNLPDSCVFAVIPRPEVPDLMQKTKNVEWRVLLRRDVLKQCLSFVYTNTTQEFRKTQTWNVCVDPSLVRSFFENYNIIQQVVSKGNIDIFYYEDLDLSHASFKKSSSDYQSLIINIDEVTREIKNYIGCH